MDDNSGRSVHNQSRTSVGNDYDPYRRGFAPFSAENERVDTRFDRPHDSHTKRPEALDFPGSWEYRRGSDSSGQRGMEVGVSAKRARVDSHSAERPHPRLASSHDPCASRADPRLQFNHCVSRAPGADPQANYRAPGADPQDKTRRKRVSRRKRVHGDEWPGELTRSRAFEFKPSPSQPSPPTGKQPQPSRPRPSPQPLPQPSPQPSPPRPSKLEFESLTPAPARRLVVEDQAEIERLKRELEDANMANRENIADIRSSVKWEFLRDFYGNIDGVNEEQDMQDSQQEEIKDYHWRIQQHERRGWYDGGSSHSGSGEWGESEEDGSDQNSFLVTDGQVNTVL